MDMEQKTARLNEIRAQINTLQAEAEQIKKEIAEATSEFRVGDHIEWAWGRGLRNGIVKEVLPGFMASPEYIVTLIRKGGSEGAMAKVVWYAKPRRYQATTA